MQVMINPAYSNKPAIEKLFLLKKLSGFLSLSLILFSAPDFSAQDLFDAVRLNDIAKVNLILSEKPLSINFRNNSGLTPLAFTVINDNLSIAELLLEKGALVNAGDNNLRAPIHFANWNRNQEMIDLLLKFGAVIDTRAIGAATPLIHSSLNNDFEMCKFLIGKGADIHIQCNSLTTPLYFGVLNNNIEYVNYLIDAGAETDVPDFLDRTQLYVAVRDGNKLMAEILIRNGADIFRKEKNSDRSYLHLACSEGHSDIAEMLIQKGLDMNEKDSYGFTPLDYAYKYSNITAAKFLESKKAGTNKVNNPVEIINPLNSKLSDGEAEIIKLQNGSWGINTKDKFIILGYSEIGTEPDDKSLMNGHISEEIFKPEKEIIYIDFDYHQLSNPFSLNGSNPIFTMKIPDDRLTCILNFRNEIRYTGNNIKKMYFPKLDEPLIIDDLKITVLPAYAANLCFIIETEGMNIMWLTGICDNYIVNKMETKIIDTIFEKNIRPDILFIGTPAGIGPELAHGMRETYIESMKLNPRSVFVFGHEQLEHKVYDQVRRKLKTIPWNFYKALNPGDSFKIKISE